MGVVVVLYFKMPEMHQLFKLYLALLAALLVPHTHAVNCDKITSSNWTSLGANKCPNGTFFAPGYDAYSAEGQSAAQYQSNCCQVSRPPPPARPRPPLQNVMLFFSSVL